MNKKISIEELKAIAIAREERIVQIPFELSESERLKDSFIQNNLKLSALKDELKKISTEYKLKIKELEERIKEEISDIRNGYREEKLTCYLIDNQDEGIMEYYTEEGKLVYSRPLRPDEKQTDAFTTKLRI